jgi:hypothetical protein
MKKRFALGALAATGLLALTGCAASGPEIRTDYDANADFARFSTFAFMDREERGVARSYDTIADRRVIAAVTRELEDRGYRLAETDPDLLVNFAISTEDVQEIRSVPSTMMPPPWYGWRAGYYYPWPAYTYETWVDTYQRGTLFIDLVDPERRQLVWEGSAVGRVTEAARGDPGAALDGAVSEIFARYPFRAGVPRQP